MRNSTEYHFLKDSAAYSDYYKANEKLAYSDNSKPISNRDLGLIQGLGYLRPLKFSHTRNNYWKYFRLTEKFQFLPLRITISVKKLRLHKKEFPVKVFILLFPFGVFSVNMDIKYEGSLAMDEFIDIVNYIPSSCMIDFNTLTINPCSFTNFSKFVCARLNDSVSKGEAVPSISSHLLVYLRKTSERLYLDRESHSDELYNHTKGFASLISGDKAIASKDERFIDEKLSVQLRPLNKEEILLFSPKRTIIYPSFVWLSDLEFLAKNKMNNLDWDDEVKNRIAQYRAERSCRCMHKNYRSCLNFIFAINGYLREITGKENEDKLDMKHAIGSLFNSNQPYYYKHAIYDIAKNIGLLSKIELFLNDIH